VHAGKLRQVTNFSIVGGTAKHCVDQYMVLFRYCSLGGDTAMPDGLHARLCHGFLVIKIKVFRQTRCRRRESDVGRKQDVVDVIGAT